MRIIGGHYRGKKLGAPEGEKTRPTTDRVKENIFNILEHRFHCSWNTLKVLDLFAGSGALGIETLSRGALHATFVENHNHAISTLEGNLSLFEKGFRISRGEVFKFLNKTRESFDLIFMDPPYDTSEIPAILEKISQKNVLNEQGILVLETRRDFKLHLPERMETKHTKSYGNTTVWFLNNTSMD